jgi:hypothetical protein
MEREQCKNLEELTRSVRQRAVVPDSKMLDKRERFVDYVHKFHKESEIPVDINHGGIILMSAHQPNLFAYSGVVRKATLIHAVAESLRNSVNCPIAELFCFADQDFAAERWFRSAQLPSVKHKGGILELNLNVSKEYKNKTMFSVPIPDEAEIEKIKAEIRRWAIDSKNSVMHHCRFLGLQVPEIELDLTSVFDVIDKSYERSTNMADFNAFFLANVINDFGCDTAFARFSECQQVLFEEMAALLENLELYSKLMSEAYSEESRVHTPIWYHCKCNGKADVEVKTLPEPAIAAKCRSCGTTYEFQGEIKTALKQMLPNISLRAEPMPIAFSGIGVSLYIGGVGGVEYLEAAEKVAHGLGVRFPVVAAWRPRDVYAGVGQLDAVLELLRINSEYNLVKEGELCDLKTVSGELSRILSHVDGAIAALNAVKADIARMKTDESKERIRFIVNIQNELKRTCELNKIARDLSLTQNVQQTLELIPSIIDYAINIGLKSTGDQWLEALKSKVDFDADIRLKINDASDSLFGMLLETYTKR